jgi:UDP-3-O-[3-hydroxymyristoyl] glucosamine N-acyltransferase
MIKLSILKNTTPGYTTYYIGDNENDVAHLYDCFLYTKKKFDSLIDKNVNQIVVDDPQLSFYKLSHNVEYNYTFNEKKYTLGDECNIHPSVVIGDNVKIGNNVVIGPNTVIYSKTEISNNVTIDSNCSIGSQGMMWVWNNRSKVFLKQLGGVKIGDGVIIGSNTAIVRGSANEDTIIDDYVNIAPGCNIGHGTFIGKNSHLANNISTGGSSYISENCFIGSGTIVSAGIKILSSNVILGAGSVVIKNIISDGVYVGNPVKKINEITDKLKGVPQWKI